MPFGMSGPYFSSSQVDESSVSSSGGLVQTSSMTCCAVIVLSFLVLCLVFSFLFCWSWCAAVVGWLWDFAPCRGAVVVPW